MEPLKSWANRKSGRSLVSDQNGSCTATDSGGCCNRRRWLERVRPQRHAANGQTPLSATTPWTSSAVPLGQIHRRHSSRLRLVASQLLQVVASLPSSLIKPRPDPCRRHRRELSAGGATAPTWPGPYRAPVTTRCHRPTSCTPALWEETSSSPLGLWYVKEEDAKESAFWCC
jgi:hypothetical protein